jgi:hypothetical protein
MVHPLSLTSVAKEASHDEASYKDKSKSDDEILHHETAMKDISPITATNTVPAFQSPSSSWVPVIPM